MVDIRRNFIAVLDTMWGYRSRQAPKYFQINPYNASGRRLYKLIGEDGNLMVVNACREQVGHANAHGIPDPQWLLASLRAVPLAYRRGILLVCGSVAQRTFAAIADQWRGPVVYMKHPAARTWTKSEISDTQKKLDRLYRARKIQRVGI